jgi:hypothetical protein
MSLKGQKHLITCRCILQQFKSQNNPPFHKFVVFSVINTENDEVQVKLSQCNNCGIVHKVTDICKSEILSKDSISSLTTIDDIKVNLPEKLLSVLDRYEIDLPSWEHINFIIENESWGECEVLSSDNIDDVVQGKYIVFYGKNLFKIEQYTKEEII